MNTLPARHAIRPFPLGVRIALAKAVAYGIACEHSIEAQPKDELPERLWNAIFVDELLSLTGVWALNTLSEDLQLSIISEAAHTAMVCPNCLRNALCNIGSDDGVADVD